MNITEIQKNYNNYFTNLYAQKLENLKEIQRFLNTYELPKLNQEELKILNNNKL